MTTFFGEILPIVSRAIDEEDDEISFKQPVVHWDCPLDEKEVAKVDSLVVAASSLARGFLDAYCLSNECVKRVGEICVAVEDSSGAFLKEERVLTIYVNSGVEPAIGYCVSTASFLNDENTWSYVDKLFQLSFFDQIHDVVILVSTSIHHYLCHEEEVETPVVKSMWTSTYQHNRTFSELKQPNTVNGLAAAILSKCELTKIPAILHVCYTDSVGLSVSSIDAFCPILKENPFQCNKKTDASLKKLKSLVSSYGSGHSLYM